ncbi:hypothetical protein M409DRAFT_57647 [Zasmidium cellare ATCC 36951]|uniref:Uncharacterized protein n=1 Tax=Zasmidium cellare ATCC 36951 TaxID=1080233 RepID=A0A6A6C851_ZASCE|nr:uncharacterized protein M409DRAFT_57647 [Zasmidium cellare ATCC 36951]KAF2163367.1 hypothetical protein M409DRAFT_57647 [Zasmidium cellare ATCC 36951]
MVRVSLLDRSKSWIRKTSDDDVPLRPFAEFTGLTVRQVLDDGDEYNEISIKLDFFTGRRRQWMDMESACPEPIVRMDQQDVMAEGLLHVIMQLREPSEEIHIDVVDDVITAMYNKKISKSLKLQLASVSRTSTINSKLRNFGQTDLAI